MTTLHTDWIDEPNTYGFNPIPESSRSIAHIIGNARDGNRYARTVEVLVKDDAAERELERIRLEVCRLGPAVCIQIREGGADLPMAAHHGYPI